MLPKWLLTKLWLRGIDGTRPSAGRRAGRRMVVPLRLEVLEDRTLPSLFGPAQFFGAGSLPNSVAVGDFNHDGNLDVAVTNSGDGTVGILLGNSKGGFAAAAPVRVGLNPVSVVAADFNHDGNLDLAVVNEGSNSVSILLGDGKGGFAPPFGQGIGPVGNGADSVAVGDFNLDGNLDLAVTNAADDTVSILLGNGSGGFRTLAPVTVPGHFRPVSVVVGNFYPNGSPDLAVAYLDSSTVSVLLGNGSGGFPVTIDVLQASAPDSLAVGDFNHDGNMDLAVGNEDDAVNVLLGNGGGSFTTVGPLAAGAAGPAFVTAADLNQDGMLDLVSANEGAGTISVLLGDGKGGFGAAVPFAVGTHPVAVAVGDFNNDGAPDLVAANQADNTVSVLLNQAFATTTTLTSSSNPAFPAQLLTLQATVAEAVSHTAQPTGLVTFMDGATVLGTGTVRSDGTAVLDATLSTTGYHFLTAVYQGDPTFTGSTSPTLNELVNQATTAVSLTSSADPSLVGQPITFKASVSAWENTLGFGQPTGTVYFQADGLTQLGSAALVNGVATLNVSSLAPGSHSIAAYYAGDNQFTPSASSALIEVVNNPAPVVTSVSPGSLNEGASAFTLTITGSNFLTGATVQWNGAPLTVTQLTGAQIQATVPAALTADEGTAQVTVTNPGPGGGASLTQALTIADAPLSALGRIFSVLGNMTFNGVVASFTDANPAATAADFAAVITWDDGSVSLGKVSGLGKFTVSGSHTFAAFKNAHHITVDIYDVGGSMATVTDTVTDPPAGKSKQNSTFVGTSNPTQGPGLNAGQAVWTSLLEPGGSVGGRLEQAAAAIASLPEHSYPLEGDAARVSLAARLEDVLWQRMGAEELPEGEIVFG